MHTILAIDTSTEACSVALLFNNEITHDFILSQRDHTKQILPMIEGLLAKSACTLNQIDAIAFGKGPGSFTGVRIGIGVAQGLALGIDKPMIGVSTLMTLAQGAYRMQHATKVIAAIDARMEEVYLGQYQYQDNHWQLITPECVISPNEVKNYVKSDQLESNDAQLGGQDYYFAGTGWQTYPNMLENIKNSEVTLPHAQDLIIIADQKWRDNDLIDVNDVEPTYLRNQVTWKKLPGKE